MILKIIEILLFNKIGTRDNEAYLSLDTSSISYHISTLAPNFLKRHTQTHVTEMYSNVGGVSVSSERQAGAGGWELGHLRGRGHRGVMNSTGSGSTGNV